MPYIFRSLSDQDPPTLIFDEADTVFPGTKAGRGERGTYAACSTPDSAAGRPWAAPSA